MFVIPSHPDMLNRLEYADELCTSSRSATPRACKVLPYRAMAGNLGTNYLRIFEMVHRFVLVPTFGAEYDKPWRENGLFVSIDTHARQGILRCVEDTG